MLFSLLMERVRLPMVLGVLLAGAMMGPASPLRGVQIGPLDFGILVVDEPATVSFFALLGSVLILFGIGLEFSVLKLVRMGFTTFLAALIKLGLTYLAGYIIASFMGLGQPAAVLLGFILSFSSTPIIIKILEGHDKLRRPESTFIVAVLIIEDLVAVALLGIMASTGLGNQYEVAMALLKVVVVFALAYAILSEVMKRLLAQVDKSDELLVLFVVGVVLMISYLCAAIGLGFSVGSFLAGSVAAATPQARRIDEMIRPFNALFASFFFFSIGMMVDPAAAAPARPRLVGILLVAVVGKLIASATASYLIGFSGHSAAFAASALLPLGELSLLIGSFAVGQGLLPAGLMGLLALVIIITSILSVFLVGREGVVYNMGKDLTPDLVSRNMSMLRSTSIGVQRVVEENSRYERIIHRLPSIGRHLAISSHDRLELTLKNTFIFMVAAAALLLALWLFAPALAAPSAPMSSAYVLIFLGFFITATLAMVNASSTFRIYIRMLRNSGRTVLEMTTHLAGLVFFVFMAAAAGMASIFLRQPPLLILLLPVALLGSVHLLAIVSHLHRAVRRFF